MECPDLIFQTNITTIVNPKNYDENIFVDVKADVCVNPPSSFALARTIEFFHIPRNVLSICLGKSTSARCVIKLPRRVHKPVIFLSENAPYLLERK